MSLLQPSEELGDEVFGLLLHIILREPLRHNMRDLEIRRSSFLILTMLVGHLFPMVYHLLQVLLPLTRNIGQIWLNFWRLILHPIINWWYLDDEHVHNTNILDACILQEFLPGRTQRYLQASTGRLWASGVTVYLGTLSQLPTFLISHLRAALHCPGQVEVLAHDRDVPPPGLVQGEHPQSRLSL